VPLVEPQPASLPVPLEFWVLVTRRSNVILFTVASMISIFQNYNISVMRNVTVS
jgi:hypothetical protein